MSLSCFLQSEKSGGLQRAKQDFINVRNVKVLERSREAGDGKLGIRQMTVDFS